MSPKSRPSVREAWNDLRAAVKTPAGPEPAEAAAGDAELPAAVAPVKRKWSTLPSATFKGDDGELQLYPDGVDHLHRLTKATIPLRTIQAVTIEDGADLEARITATRLVLIGVFALAFRKRRGGEKYLAIESDDAFTVVEVGRKDIAKAQNFAAAVRTATKGTAR